MPTQTASQLTEDFTKAQEKITNIVSQIKEFCVSDASLEDRWEMYLQIEDQLYTTESLDTDEEYSPYDDFGMNGNETCSFSDIVGILKMRVSNGQRTEDDIDDFKEYVLESGFGSYKWDC